MDQWDLGTMSGRNPESNVSDKIFGTHWIEGGVRWPRELMG